ncbi:oligoendopeptidase F [Brevibacillus ruminantium]|uniref:Oligopeptidase F n=1 Tax=Brevibacillus ruminantium TaxID=2950604 RepID=A0ABY4WMP0_9BACL|nr:oligoendopeptidase F [Brevibacillus ruminantium]USG68420.1 oligoendopeptidase F [Brevibacillus ruminantium]
MKERKTRDQVPTEQTWNLEDLFSSVETWEAELLHIQELARSLQKYKGRLHEGGDVLLACLETEEEIRVRMGLAATYARLRLSEDEASPMNQANSSRAGDVQAEVGAALTFILSEILALPDGTVENFIRETPALESFRKSLADLLETKPHSLSSETETVLASLGEVLGAPHTIYQRSKLADMSFSQVQDGNGATRPVSFSLYETNYASSTDTILRRAAFRSFTITLDSYKNTIAAVYATEVKRQTVTSRLRGYESVTHMLLHLQQVTMEMYLNIVDIIRTELAPHMRRFVRLKQRVLGLERMMFSDLKAPLDPDFIPQISFEEAGRMVVESLKVLGPEYTSIMERALSDRWVDYADNVGKSTGAFCSTPYGGHSYILITWSGSMRGAFTLAHELGHAGHLMLAGRNQRFTDFRPTLYCIEAPSTMNELLLAQHIVEQSADQRLKRWVLLQLMGTYYHNFVTHLLEADMQRRVYAAAEAGEPLTASKLCELKGLLLSEFWGDTVELDKGANLTWMRQPHYYRGLYPYTYAAGLTVSTAVASLIREEGQPAVDRWLSMLKAGGTLRPLELMKLAGVDMSNPQPIRSAIAYVGSLVDELEQLF